MTSKILNPAGRGPAGGVLGGLLPALVALLTALLAGCAIPIAETQRDSADLKTSSDQTSAERRAQLRLELAAGYFGRGQYTTALDEVKLAIAAKPEVPEAFNLRGLIYAALAQPKLAEESFRRALQLAPRDPDTMHNFGWFLCQERRYPDAEEQFRNALAQPQYRDPARTLFTLGVCQARTARWAEAEGSLSKAYEMDPANPMTAYNLSDVLYRRGEFERARFYMRRVNAQQDVSNAQTLWLAARIENKLGNPSGARALGTQLRDRFPQSPEALSFDRGRFDD